MTDARGLPVRSEAGPFGTHMWSRRWAADMEAGVDGRDAYMAGRDARRGRVLSLDHSGRTVRCEVAGSRPRPFTVEFTFAPLDAADSEALGRALRHEAGGVVGALAGDFSDAVGFLLLPAVRGATGYSCECPVRPGPCRHVLAAAYLVVEWWDAAPAVLFALRGLGTDELGVVLGDDGSGALSYDVREGLWGDDPLLPVVPTPAPAGLEDLLDAPVTRRLAAAATPDPLEQLRVVADLEDVLDALTAYEPASGPGEDTGGSPSDRSVSDPRSTMRP